MVEKQEMKDAVAKVLGKLEKKMDTPRKEFLAVEISCLVILYFMLHMTKAEVCSAQRQLLPHYQRLESSSVFDHERHKPLLKHSKKVDSHKHG